MKSLSKILNSNISQQLFYLLVLVLFLRIDLVFENNTPTGGDMGCLLYTSPSPRDKRQSRMPSSA